MNVREVNENKSVIGLHNCTLGIWISDGSYILVGVNNPKMNKSTKKWFNCFHVDAGIVCESINWEKASLTQVNSIVIDS